MQHVTVDRHLAITSGSPVSQLGEPLVKKFSLSLFGYHKTFNDGTEVLMTNQPDLLSNYYNTKLYKKSGFQKHPCELASGCVLWAHLTDHQPILELAYQYNAVHGLTLLNKVDDGCEFFILGVPADQTQQVNRCINDLDNIQLFYKNFKRQANTLLKQAHQQRIFIPDKYAQVDTTEQAIPGLFEKKTTQSKSVHSQKIIHPQLTSRERDCVKLLLEGKKMREIANQLNISSRTVETHIQHLKHKFSVHSQSQLIIQLLKTQMTQ